METRRRKHKARTTIRPTVEVLYAMETLDVLLNMDGSLAAMPAAFFHALPPDAIRLWAHENGVWTFPTDELLAWLRDLIGDRFATDTRGQPSALEIGAGNGGIARALGIPATDSHVQVTDTDIRGAIEGAGQSVSIPGAHVEKLEALEAVEKYKPHTVIGAYVTHKWRAGETEGFVYGVDEEELLRRVSRYVVIGNDGPHGGKHIMRRPHRTIRAPWLITRAIKPELNAIYVWEGSVK